MLANENVCTFSTYTMTHAVPVSVCVTHLEDVDKEVWVEVWPVMSTNVNDEFDEFVADERWHLLVIGQQQLAEHGANLILVTAQEAHPLSVDEVLSEHREHCAHFKAPTSFFSYSQ